MKKNKIIEIHETEDCPSDKLMKLYRENSEDLRKNVLFSQSSINFFKNMADIVEKNEKILTFYWEPIVEENLPSLKIKVQKKGKNYELMYLKEKVTYIERQNEFKGRITLNINQSKLRKLQNGTVTISKREERER